jgi:hypothetical protein
MMFARIADSVILHMRVELQIAHMSRVFAQAFEPDLDAVNIVFGVWIQTGTESVVGVELWK